MDKKKINTLLIVAVACIWGIVLYKFIAPYFTENEVPYTAEIPTEMPLEKVRKKDTVALNFPERDPFLGKAKRPRTKSIQPKKKPVRRSSKVTKPILWPKIEYLGFVKSNSNKDRLGLVRIDGKLHRVKRNTEVAGIRIEKISSDALVISNGKEERSFKRN